MYTRDYGWAALSLSPIWQGSRATNLCGMTSPEYVQCKLRECALLREGAQKGTIAETGARATGRVGSIAAMCPTHHHHDASPWSTHGAGPVTRAHLVAPAGSYCSMRGGNRTTISVSPRQTQFNKTQTSRLPTQRSSPEMKARCKGKRLTVPPLIYSLLWRATHCF